MATINWDQIGTDFKAKYEGTYCRYKSPVTRVKEIFNITLVEPHHNSPPDLVLFNKRAGELYLKYDTEVELDFSLPETRNFQHKNKALRFVRLHERQWKKGLCAATGRVLFQYASVMQHSYPELNEEIIGSAFNTLSGCSISQAQNRLAETNDVSVVLSPDLSLGCGNSKEETWLWFQTDPIAIVKGNEVQMKIPTFKQEVQDLLRDTGDYARTIV